MPPAPLPTPPPPPDPVTRRRLAEKADRIRRGDVDPVLLWSWVRERAPRLALHAREVDLADLLADRRLAPSGLSDVRAGLATPAVVEGYVSPASVDALVTEFLLVEGDRPNVWLHVADIPTDAAGRVPLGFVIADLLDHPGPRERARAAALLHAWPDEAAVARSARRAADASAGR